MRLSDQHPSLPRVERQSTVTAVMETLRGLVDSADYPTGAKLPSERVLREQLGVGRSTVREALRALEALGLIELRQGEGAFVADPALRSPANGFSSWPMTDWDITAVVEARLAIEPDAAAAAALRCTAADLAVVSRHLEEFEDATEADDLPRMALADTAFHDSIVAIANPVLASFLESVRVSGIRSRTTSLGKRARRATVVERHRRIYKALHDRDATAAHRAMQSHLFDFATELGLAPVWPLRVSEADEPDA
jgi:GntR family transcriptional regulator, transcriptional repressor for pyruvate dehydrogenase complex